MSLTGHHTSHRLCCVFFSAREPELVLLDVQSVAAGQEGWLAFDVTTASNHWLLQPRSNLGIRLYVETEEGRCSAQWHDTSSEHQSSSSNTVWPQPLPPPPPLQTALCLQAGSGWWADGALAPNSPSWWPSSGRTRSRVALRELLSPTHARRSPNTTSQCPAYIVRFRTLSQGLQLWCFIQFLWWTETFWSEKCGHFEEWRFNWINFNLVCSRFCNQVNLLLRCFRISPVGFSFSLKLHQRTKNLNDIVQNSG